MTCFWPPPSSSCWECLKIGQFWSEVTMGTVLSFMPREKAPPYVTEYNITNGNQMHRYSKENILIHNNNGAMPNGPTILTSASKAIIEKGMKKHNMFLNALSWKRFTAAATSATTSGRTKSNERRNNEAQGVTNNKENQLNHQNPTGRNPSNKNGVGQFSRPPLDNVHPYIENQKNIQVIHDKKWYLNFKKTNFPCLFRMHCAMGLAKHNFVRNIWIWLLSR